MRVRASCIAAGVALAVVVGCGDGRPPPGTIGFAQTPPPALGGPGTKNTLPGCGQQQNGGYCDCVDAPLTYDQPNMYFVLDRSGSMQEDDKWDTVRLTVANVMRQVGARAKFGAMIFPGGNGDDCNPGSEILKTATGDPPNPGGGDGPLVTALVSATAAVAPHGGTPTAAGLGLALSKLQTLSGRSFVILATDGGPNCNEVTQCDATKCQDNIENISGCPPGGPPNCCAPPLGDPRGCLDDVATEQAAAALAQAKIPVYVVGIPGSSVYADVLDQTAVSGGTPQSATSPKYFRVDSTDQSALLAALKKVAAKITATCTFNLTQVPGDPNLVNVYFDEEVVPKDPNWTLDGTTLTLQGLACDAVKNGDVIDVRIIVGCPTALH
ncbi:MAG TPA: vWA domain-containing protein [Labilithrix sp.]